jgi:hypothetical protein
MAKMVGSTPTKSMQFLLTKGACYMNTITHVLQTKKSDEIILDAICKQECVRKETVENAKKILEQLPEYVTIPDIEAHSDGSISFEWFLEDWWFLNLCIDEYSELAYSGFFGSKNDDYFGRELFGGTLPNSILEGLFRFHKKIAL